MRPVRLASFLGAACAVSALLVFPYVLVLFPHLAHAKAPLGVIVAAQSAQAGVLGFVLSWIGLRLGRDRGLGAPILSGTAKHAMVGHFCADLILHVVTS